MINKYFSVLLYIEKIKHTIYRRLYTFSLSWFYQLHMYIIGLGVISLMTAIYIIKYKKDKSWRIKRHQLMSIIGVILILIGVITMIVGKESKDLIHFNVPHAFGGGFALLLMIITIILAKLGMKGNQKLMKGHRLLGRITGVVVLAVAVVGITVAISYI